MTFTHRTCTVKVSPHPPRGKPKMMPGRITLDMTRAHLARFVSFPSDAALDLSTLWAAHTHARTTTEQLAWSVSPRLMFLSDKRGSGKSQAMQRVLGLSFHGRMVIDPTPQSFATMISQNRATVAIDEIDCLFGAGAAKQQLRGLLNAGYTPGAEFSRGKDATIDCFAAVVMAGLGARVRVAAELDPLRSRSIIVEMVPSIPPEFYERRDHDVITAAYRDQLSGWVRRNLRMILDQRPEMPEGIELRMREVCYPLFAIADAAGGHWPETARDAARQLLLGEHNEADPDELDLFGQLLSDLRDIYGDADRMPTDDIVAGLYDRPASTWAELWPNPGKAPKELAAMLRPLGAEPTVIRFADGPARGYHRYVLEPLWTEMLAADDVTSVTVTPGRNNEDDMIDLDEDADETIDA